MKINRLLIMFLLSMVLIAIVIIINVSSLSSIQEVLITQIKDTQLLETEYAANQIENHILQAQNELVTLSQFPDIDTIDEMKCRIDETVVHEEFPGALTNVLLVDKEGTIIECSSPLYSSYAGLNIKNKDYFRKTKETNEPYIDSSTAQDISRRIFLAVPLFETTEYTPYPNFIGEFEGILLSIIEVNGLYDQYIYPIANPEKAYFLLVNDRGETIIKSNNIAEYDEIKHIFPETLNEISDFDPFGDTIITSSKLSLGSETWELIILTPLKNADRTITEVQNRLLLTLASVIVIILGGLAFTFFMYKSKEKAETKLEKASVTLEKLGINIEVEGEKYSQADISLEPKKIYLIKEDDENNAHELFISSLNRGFAGLGIVRDNPQELRKKYNLQKTSFIWLSKTKEEGTPSETRIENLYELIKQFAQKSEKSVILFDRFDYVISENKFENVIKKMHELKDLVQANNCIMIISINPDTIKENELKAIEADTIDLYGKHLKKKVDLSDMEMEMLKFINNHNISNRLVSYKDITAKFEITKPTTRSKINNLRELGLLHIDQKGRFKSLKITSAGRRIMG